MVGRPVRQYLLMAVIWRRSEKRRGKCTIRISTNARHVHAGLSSFVTTTLTLLALAIGQAGSAMAEGVRVTLMTRNMYVGSSFSETRVRQDGGLLRVGVCSDYDGGP